MSKRTNLARIQSPLGPSRSWFSIVLCILIAALAIGTAQASTVVRISSSDTIQPGDTIVVPVTLDSVTGGLDIAGFDFLIAWEPTGFRLIEAQPGQLLTDCGWEYFNAATSSMTEWNGLPANIPTVRIVSLADLNNGDVHPTCNATTPGELVRLIFEASSHPMNHGGTAPIRFLWTDCGDNGMALSDGSLLLSEQVFDEGWDWSVDRTFPTWQGAPNECEGPGAVREIDFYNGRIQFADSDTSSEADAAAYIIGESETWLGSHAYAEVGVTNLRSPWEAAGFEMLIEYDHTGISLLSVAPSDDLDAWGWEYFEYRFDSVGQVRLIVIAEMNNGSHHPSNLLNQDCDLAIFDFRVVNNPANIGRELPIRFLWADCGDNSFASAPDGDSLYISHDVYDEYGFLMTADEPFPTNGGAPGECLSAPTVRRSVDFYGGFIKVISDNPWESGRGDLNLNTVPYELADYIVFVNYFFYGLSAFTFNIEEQIANSDVNADGLTLSFNDLAFLNLVMMGYIEPIWNKAGSIVDTAVIIQDTTDNSLSVSWSSELSLLFLTFNGLVEPSLYDSSALYVLWHQDGNSAMMISPDLTDGEDIQMISTGFLMNYTGDGLLVSAQVGYDGVTPVPTVVQVGQGTPCCVDRGNINHDPTGALDISDLVYIVTFMFNLGPPPPCSGEADVNGDGLGGVDIADLVYLVDYMFNGGPAPVPCR